ncbi:MAG: HAD family phosphatase, partial [Bacteroidales bacterium]|nr:HAD family phosphatase [Bacteroidales bacterium]
MERCVIFDMDGVIIDSEPIHQECEKRIFNLLGITVSDEEHSTLTGATDETMWSGLGKRHNLPLSVAEAIRLKKSIYLEHLMRETSIEPLPDVAQLIVNLHKHGFLLAVASSSPHEQIDFILKKFELSRYFHAIVSGEDVEAGKPHPEIFLKAADMLGVTPDSCLVIEDSHNGVTAAKRAGMKCIWFINPNSGNQDLIGKVDLLI